jgi:hypothetical protein
MDTLRSTLEDAAMRYCPPHAAPRKEGCPKNNKCIKSPLVGKKKRKSIESSCETTEDDNQGEEEGESDTSPTLVPKRGKSMSQC